MAAGITTTWLRAAWTGKDKWKSDGAARGAGQLVARRRRNGVLLYFRYTPEPGAEREAGVALGPYDEKGLHGLTLAQAREKASELARNYRAGKTDLHAHIQEKLRAAEREKAQVAAAAARAAEEAQRSTLKQMLDTYVKYLEGAGKVRTAADTESIFTKHVYKADPALAIRKAAEVTVEEFVQLIARLAEAGKGRTAAKLRSGLRAAFGLAIRSRTDPAAPQSLRSFGVSVNPIAGIGAMSQFNRVRDRHLSAPELGAFLRRIDAMSEGPQKDALRLTLLLGGQRPMQLLRLKPSEVDITAGAVTLHDAKGARKQPRVHILPLVKEAQMILERRLEKLADGEPVFSTDGKHSMRVETLGGAVAEIVKAMLNADPPEAREAFQLRDLRRTCETQLAGLKVSSDIRAQIQSHGLGGIQIRHYDRHSYALEKKQALEKWARHLAKLKAGDQATVTELRAKAAE
jgi:integrase